MTDEPIRDAGFASDDHEDDAAPATFEDALMRLADAVRQLEEGNLSLDESLARYESGIRHLGQCQKILSTAERKIEILSGFDAEGNPVTRNFDDEEMTLEEKADTRSKRRSANPSRNKKSKATRKTSENPDASENETAEVNTPAARKKKPAIRKRRPATRPPGASDSAQQDDVDAGGTLF